MARRRFPKPQIEALERRTVPAGLSLVANWTHEGGGHYFSDLWAEGNFVYLGHLIDQLGVDIIDISNPSKPVLASVFRGTGGDNDLRDVHVRNGVGFFASDTDGGVYIVDVSDPYNPRQLARISTAIGGAENTHTLSVEGDYLYQATTRTTDVHVFNIRDPSNPRFVRLIPSGSKYPVHEVTALGGRLYTAVIGFPGMVEVFDVSNVEVEAPLLGSLLTADIAHTTWPILGGQYAAVAREEQGGDVEIWDIRNLGSPVLVSQIGLPPDQAWSAHQVMSVGPLLYVSWYQAGVRVYDLSDPVAPVLVADYDTFPDEVVGFAGSWGVYPYLGPDRILASDINTGLYILAHSSAPGAPPGGNPPARPAPRPLPPKHPWHTASTDPRAAGAGMAHHLTAAGSAAPSPWPDHHPPAFLAPGSDHGRAPDHPAAFDPVGLDHGRVRAPLWHKPG